MSTNITKRMLEAYRQEATPTPFLSGMFQSPARNFHSSEEVEIDIVRSEEDVAIAVQDLSTGYRLNAENVFTNKSFKPPVFKEAAAINAHTLIKRQPGVDPFQTPDFQANAIQKAFGVFRKLEQKIRRATEQQAAQVLQTGVVTLIDDAGASVYAIDYKPKATHFPTAGTAWSSGSSTKLADLQALIEVIRGDGLVDCDQLVFGEDSLRAFLDDDKVLKYFNQFNANFGRIIPAERMGNGGTFHGMITIGSYNLEIWSYNARYKHQQTGVSTKLIGGDKVIVRSSGARMDATFGAIPRITSPDSRVLQFLPERFVMQQEGMDLTPNAWITADGETLYVGAGSRPLMVPTAIDTYGCLDTGL
jgi:hypothetical protein